MSAIPITDKSYEAGPASPILRRSPLRKLWQQAKKYSVEQTVARMRQRTTRRRMVKHATGQHGTCRVREY